MSSSMSEANLEKKFQAATNTQDSIQTLSLWLLHHKAHHQKIVSSWMKTLQKAKISHRLTLFYLANDVVQNSKRKSFIQFVNSFAEVLKEATLLVRDDSIRPSIQRVFNIWEQRNVYSPEFVADLRAILANTKVPATAPSKLLSQFKPESVVEKIRSVSKLEIDVNKKMASINLNKLKATDAEIVQQFKDRIHGQQFKRDFDDSASRLEDLIKVMEKEMAERTELILLLEQSEIYYDSQRGEARIVANAYKNFGGRIEKLQKKLEELSASLPSPLPSPSVDAPSPTTSDQELELKLPSDNKEKGMTSWLDAFSKKEPLKALAEKVEPKKIESSSLESRLSNLMQNMPSLPPGIQNTLFGNNSSSGNNTPLRETADSTASNKKEKVTESSSIPGILTPVKDDYSGQNTPLQDEDTHSSHAFFSKLASSNKTHSPKDILKGLTNLIQSAAADKEDSQKKFSPFPPSDLFQPQSGMSTFIKSIIPSVSKSPQTSSSSSSNFFNPASQPAVSSTARTVSGNITTTVSSYHTASFDSVPTYSTRTPDQNEQRSFIPSLVPSTPHKDSFGFAPKTFSNEEYNPEMEIYDTDMDIDDSLDGTDTLIVPSPDHEPLPPVPVISTSEAIEAPRPIPGRRLSTLITLVTDNTPEQSLPNNEPYSDDVYKSDKENFTDEAPAWAPTSGGINKSAEVPVLPPDIMANSPNEEYFIGKQPQPPVVPFYTSAPPPPMIPPPNGQNAPYLNPVPPSNNPPLSRIETVQSQREDQSNRWFNNNWAEDNVSNPFPSTPPVHQNPPGGRIFNNHRNFAPQQFNPRQNWPNRNRPDGNFPNKRNHSFSPRPYGPPSNKRFPFRGRGGWGRNSQY